MGKNKFCGKGTMAVMLQLRENGKSYGKIANSLNISKVLVFNVIQYYKKNKTTRQVSHRRRARKTSFK